MNSGEMTIKHIKPSEMADILKSGRFPFIDGILGRSRGSFPYVRFEDVRFNAVESNGDIVGLVGFCVSKYLSEYRILNVDFNHTSFGHVFALEVSPQHRNSNIGTQLIKSAVEDVKSEGDKGVTVVAKDENLERYYKRNGFSTYRKGTVPEMEVVF